MVAVSGGKDSLALWDVLIEDGYQTAGLYLDLGHLRLLGGVPGQVRGVRGRARPDAAHRAGGGGGGRAAFPVVQQVTRRPTCSACGLSKRYLMNRAALEHGYPVVATGHNLDDEAATLFGSVMHWQTDALPRQSPALASTHPKLVRRVKPLYRLSELETAGLRVPARHRLHRGGVPVRQGRHVDRPQGGAEPARGGLARAPSTTSCSASSRRPARPSSAIEHVELLECTSCGQVTTGAICAFCKLADLVKRRTS